MKISVEQREQVRLSLLRYGLAGGGFKVGLATAYLRAEGWKLERSEVQAEINYLAHPQKGLLEQVAKAVSPEVAEYRTTPNGQDYLAQVSQD